MHCVQSGYYSWTMFALSVFSVIVFADNYTSYIFVSLNHHFHDALPMAIIIVFGKLDCIAVPCITILVLNIA